MRKQWNCFNKQYINLEVYNLSIILLGCTFYEEENDDKALELIREVVKLNPSSYFPYNILGDIYMKQEKWTEANNDYKTMIERIKYGYVPGLEFETDFIGGCYLFGCKRHNHLEYEQ